MPSKVRCDKQENILSFLKDERIFSIVKSKDKVILKEECDKYFKVVSVYLNHPKTTRASHSRVIRYYRTTQITNTPKPIVKARGCFRYLQRGSSIGLQGS